MATVRCSVTKQHVIRFYLSHVYCLPSTCTCSKELILMSVCRWSLLTWVCWWLVPSTGESLRSVSRSSWRKSSRMMTSFWCVAMSPYFNFAAWLVNPQHITQHLVKIKAIQTPLASAQWLLELCTALILTRCCMFCYGLTSQAAMCICRITHCGFWTVPFKLLMLRMLLCNCFMREHMHAQSVQ